MTNSHPASLNKRLVAEAVGTAALVIAVVGSGIMADRLAAGNGALAHLSHSIAVGAALVVILLVFIPISGGYINPALTLAFWLRKEISSRGAALYVVAQLVGGVAGAVVAHLMFSEPVLEWSVIPRSGGGQILGEFIATLGLIGAILGCVHGRRDAVPLAAGLFIASAIWFTSSTSFANPALTVARVFTSSPTGIGVSDVLPFVAAQAGGAIVATAFFSWIGKE